MSVLIGTSGWHYLHWRNHFYPPGLRPTDWLAYYSHRFATVEVNNAFYRLPEASTFEKWAATLPDDFVVSVKASRYLTHVRRLQQPREPVQRLMGRAVCLGPKLGPVLLQLPPNLPINLKALRLTLKEFPPEVKVAVEFRHESWFVEPIRRLLDDMGAACCLTDVDGRHGPLWTTADWGYIRFHHGRGTPDSCYGRTALNTWAGRLEDLWPPSADIFAYFNNDAHGCALRDARRFALALGRRGLLPTRVPPARETPLD